VSSQGKAIVMDRPPSPSPALPDAVTAHIDDARYRLRHDALAAGVSETLVDDALAHAVEDYRDAHVNTFIGVLVERQVRESLGLRSPRLHDTAD